MYLKNRPSLAIAAAMTAVIASGARADVEGFYKGKTITMLVASGAGGGYDVYARILADSMPKHIPGQPTIVVKNNGGGGGLIGANFIYNVAPKDGSYIGGLQRSAPLKSIMKEPGPQYDATKFNWLGSLNSEVNVCVVWANAPVKTLEEAKSKQVIMGSSGPNDTEMVPAILNNLVGTKFKVIQGYPSTVQIGLAMERGEVHGQCSSYGSLSSRHPRWFSEKKVRILVQNATRKHADLPNVPLNNEFVSTTDDKAIFELNEARLAFGRPFVAPPGVPADRIKALRTAFVAATKDEAFLKEIKRQKRELDVMTGEEVAALINKISKTPPALIAKLKEVQVFRGERGKAVIKMITASGEITSIKRDGRRVAIKTNDGKTFKAKVSGSQTKITVAGAKAKRKAFKVGMTCKIKSPGSGETAANIDCK